MHANGASSIMNGTPSGRAEGVPHLANTMIQQHQQQHGRHASNSVTSSTANPSQHLHVPSETDRRASLSHLHISYSHMHSTDLSSHSPHPDYPYHLQPSASPEPSEITPLPYRADGTPRKRQVTTPRKPPPLILPTDDELDQIVHAALSDQFIVQQPLTGKIWDKTVPYLAKRWWHQPRKVILLVTAFIVLCGIALTVVYFTIYNAHHSSSSAIEPVQPPAPAPWTPIIPLHPADISYEMRVETADPSVMHVNGVYYLTRIGSHNNIEMMSGTTLEELQNSQPVTVYQASNSYTYSTRLNCALPISQMWAPELNFVFGAYHIYFTASPVNGVDWHRVYVVRSTVSNTPNATYEFIGQVVTDNLVAYNPATHMPAGSWAIDPSTFVTPSDNQTWLLYSGDIFGNGDNSGGNQKIYLLPLADATTVYDSATPPTLLTQPELIWEVNYFQPFFWVNEGPAAYVHQNRLYVTYAASFCSTPFYSIGAVFIDLPTSGSTLATLRQSIYSTTLQNDTSNNYVPLATTSATNWHKLQEPIISANTSSGMYGIGGGQWYTQTDPQTNVSAAYYAFHYTGLSAGTCGFGRNTATVQMTFADVPADQANAQPATKLTLSS